ncbi:DUF4157 domain-containing protein [Phenylobacterium immobile]|uniref:eCIS core domain-containing protein n=1 Tax=Phenylobacterium immobile TaxID=21 RepID=UPI000AF45D43|nr:DUF4157 domain-containing protein [Phenylobacterium immobile]
MTGMVQAAKTPARQPTASPARESPTVRRLAQAKGHGAPLAPAVRLPLEQSFGVSLEAVRVHTGGDVAQAVEDHGARALTYGADIYLASGESAADLKLIGHEAAHVVQQRASPALQPKGVGGGALEREADSAAAAAASGAAFSVEGRTSGPAVQAKSLLEDGAAWLGDVASGVVDFSESIGWRMVDQFAPDLAPILRKGPQGIVDWAKEKVSAGVQAVFETMMAPVRAVTGFGAQLSAEFAPMVVWAKDAAAKIAKNDCTPFREAADKIEQVATRIIQPIVERVQPVIAKIESFFTSVWNTIGAPVWEWLKSYAAAQWKAVTEVADWVWNKAEPIRRVAAQGWTWFKNKLGVGDGPEGQNGILQWVQAKLAVAGDWIKEKLAPYQKEVTAIAAVVGGLLIMVSPAGPIVLLGGAIYGVIQAVSWIKANWGKGDAVVRARVYLERTLIPAMLGHVSRLTGGLVGAANSLAASIQQFAAKISGAAGALAGTVLSLAVSAVTWLAGQINALAEWATGKLVVLAGVVASALGTLSTFMQRVLTFLSKVANVVIDVWALQRDLLGKVWNAIPACVRDPFIDFIIPLILRQIELFRELVKDKTAWDRTKADVTNLIEQVFDNRDLMGAIRATFQLLLRAFNVPVELAAKVWAKAQAAWDVVVAKPIEFIKNTVRAIGKGFSLLWKNIKSHLAYGLEGWLLAEVSEKGVQFPTKWTDPMQVFQFVLSIMGLSMDHVFELLKKRFDKVAVDKLKVFWRRFVKVVDWVRNAIDTSKSPAENTKGIIQQAKGFGTDILTGIAEWIAARVATEIAIMAAAAAASGGLSEVVDVLRRVYKAIVSAVRWARQILEMAERVLDGALEVANGAIDAAGARFEGAMHKAMPVVICFLADQVGLGGVGQKIRDIIEAIRARVDAAILWLIDAIKAMIQGLVNLVASGVQALLKWWKLSASIPVKDGEPHDLTFSDDASDPVLGIHSDWKDLSTFVAEAKAGSPTSAQAVAIAAIEAGMTDVGAKKLIAKAATTILEGQPNDTAKEAAQKRLDDALSAMQKRMDGMTPHIAVLLGTGPVGSEKNPIEIEYPKRRADAYAPLYIGPKSATRIEQSEMAAGDTAAISAKLTKAEDAAWAADGRRIRRYFPWSSQMLPDSSGTLGITADNQIEVGMARKYKEGSTQGGGKINAALAPFGYRSRINGGEGLDGDHVVEMQIGGVNELKNLWPLGYSENRSSGSLLKNQVDAAKERIKKPKTVVKADSFWLIIKTVRAV